MTIKVLDIVVLTKDLPEYKLKQGDVGAVVEVYSPLSPLLVAGLPPCDVVLDGLPPVRWSPN